MVVKRMPPKPIRIGASNVVVQPANQPTQAVPAKPVVQTPAPVADKPQSRPSVPTRSGMGTVPMVRGLGTTDIPNAGHRPGSFGNAPAVAIDYRPHGELGNVPPIPQSPSKIKTRTTPAVRPMEVEPELSPVVQSVPGPVIKTRTAPAVRPALGGKPIPSVGVPRPLQVVQSNADSPGSVGTPRAAVPVVSVPSTPTIGRAVGHIIVDALAGTGKTFTCLEGIRRIIGQKTPGIIGSEQQEVIWAEMIRGQRPSSIVMTAFNKSIATELSRQVPKGVNAQTMHGLGLQFICKTVDGKVTVQKDKTCWLLEDELDMDIRQIRSQMKKFVPAVTELVKLCKVNCVDVDRLSEREAVETIEGLVSHFGVQIPDQYLEEVYRLVPILIAKSRQRTDMIDFDDMVWLPTAINLQFRRVDLLVVDERQDLNKAQQELALKAGRRIIMVGDRHQAIYGFTGADANACDTMNAKLSAHPLGCKVFPLTYTRRCGKAIVELANQQVPELEAMIEAPDGEISYGKEETFVEELKDGDMVVCRTNAPLIRHAMALLRRRVKVRIQGKSIGDDLIEIIDGTKAEDVDDFVYQLESWYKSSLARLGKRKYAEAQLMLIEDQYQSLLAFTVGTATISAMKADIKKLFDDTKTEGILFSSIHRCKGLEADHVYFLQHDKMPHPMAIQPWQRKQEDNLWYVAVTRAKTLLCLVQSEAKKSKPQRDEGE